MQKNSRKKGVLAMDFGSHSLKLVVCQQNNQKIKVLQMFSIDFEPDFYENGHIKAFDEMKTLIVDNLKKHKIKLKNVVVSMESTDIIKREITIPHVAQEDQMDLINYEVNQYLPIDLETYILQYKILRAFEEDERAFLEVKLGAMPKEMAKKHYDLLTQCGLLPQVLDIHSHTIEAFVKWNFEGMDVLEKNTIAFIDFGYSMISINLIEKGSFVFNRIISINGREIMQMVSEKLEIPQSEVNKKLEEINIFELQDARRQLLAQNRATEEYRPLELVVDQFGAYLEDWLEELSKVFKYYTSRSIENSIDQIYIYGGNSNLEGLSDYMQQKLESNVQILRPLNKIEFTPKITDHRFQKYIHAFGSYLSR
ncbi:type IV pilus assembly protein PilM [Fusibacter sp. 3D3]|uniref:type IV pilus assembly protein PilM n=1 Tax=Fusibacter sp. 3D3 TaxID=1048380 RepID=UPI000852CC0D|nr:type IV pilus assembly protein PilM [Fusibacter sp. 3D3]GAU79404.1 type IV pilus biogenesis protein PilM [Fusibacter sp. 3D3]